MVLYYDDVICIHKWEVFRIRIRKIGIGSISILLFVVGFLFIINFNNGICIGDNILNYIGLKAWSDGNQGTHYTVFYSIIFFIPSVVVGYKFNKNFGSKLGGILSLIMLALITFAVIFMAKI